MISKQGMRLAEDKLGRAPVQNMQAIPRQMLSGQKQRVMAAMPNGQQMMKQQRVMARA